MIIGIDEVGRGCWAGPLLAAAVVLPDNTSIAGLNDSKKLSVKQRQQLVHEVQLSAVAIGVGWVWPREINDIGLTESVRLAMQRAVDQVDVGDLAIVIDGNFNYLQHIDNTTALVRADGSILEVSAASIVAKVARDAYMYKISEIYPEYGFERHVGYGTKKHIEALEKHGLTPIHRVHYKPIKKLLARNT